MNKVFLNEELKSNIRESKVPINYGKKPLKMPKSSSAPEGDIMIKNLVHTDSSTPPPLPPRAPLSASRSSDPDAVNSLNKQMSYPLVATCATLVNNYVSNM